MNKVIERTIDRAAKMLTATGAQFRIVTPDGIELGALQPQPARRKNKVRDARNYGELAAYMRPYLAGMRQGDVVQIPYHGYHKEHLRGAIAAHLSNTWGPGTYTTCVTEQHVEVLRVE